MCGNRGASFKNCTCRQETQCSPALLQDTRLSTRRPGSSNKGLQRLPSTAFSRAHPTGRSSKAPYLQFPECATVLLPGYLSASVLRGEPVPARAHLTKHVPDPAVSITRSGKPRIKPGTGSYSTPASRESKPRRVGTQSSSSRVRRSAHRVRARADAPGPCLRPERRGYDTAFTRSGAEAAGAPPPVARPGEPASPTDGCVRSPPSRRFPALRSPGAGGGHKRAGPQVTQARRPGSRPRGNLLKRGPTERGKEESSKAACSGRSEETPGREREDQEDRESSRAR